MRRRLPRWRLRLRLFPISSGLSGLSGLARACGPDVTDGADADVHRLVLHLDARRLVLHLEGLVRLEQRVLLVMIVIMCLHLLRLEQRQQRVLLIMMGMCRVRLLLLRQWCWSLSGFLGVHGRGGRWSTRSGARCGVAVVDVEPPTRGHMSG